MPDPAHIATDKAIEELEKELFEFFNAATGEMLKKQEYNMVALNRQLSEVKDKYFKQKISKEEYLDFVRMMAMSDRWYTEMVTTLGYDAVMADVNAAAIINGKLPETYALNFNWGTYQIENGARINTAFTLYDKNTVVALLKQNPNLYGQAVINQRKDLAWNQQKFRSVLMQGVLQGDPLDRIAENIASVMNMNYNAAKRTARTAMTGAQNAGRIGSYERAQRLGIMGKKRWVATLDKYTRDSHRDLDGVAVDIHDKFQSGDSLLDYPGDETGDPSEYMNCRCTLIYEFDGTDYDHAERFTRLDDKTSFDEFMENH